MDNTTAVANEVVENVAEETIEKIGASTIITGVCAATGAAVMIYGLGKGAKWLYGKVKDKAASKKAVEEIEDDFDEEFEDEGEEI